MSLLLKVQRKLKELDNRKKQFIKAAQGKNRFRVLPSWRGDGEEFYKEVPTHYNMGPEKKKSFPCPRMIEKRCPACDRADRYAASDEAKKQARAQLLYPQARVHMNVIDRNNVDAGVRVWSISAKMLHDLLSFFADPDYGDFTNPLEGFDVIFNRKGENLQTKYENLHLSRIPSKIGLKGWRSALLNLDKFKPLVPPDAGMILSIMKGEEVSNGESD